MTTETTDQGPDVEQVKSAALQLMTEKIYCPAFFEKLAYHGIRPNSESDAQYLLAMNQKLEEMAYEKQAQAEPNSFLKAAYDTLLGQDPYTSHERQVSDIESRRLKQAALNVVDSDPELMAAALIYNQVVSE